MNKLEFQHVLLVCRILDVGKEKKLVEKVFVSANKQRNNNPASDARSLTRFEFFEALLNLACHRFGIGAWDACRSRPVGAFVELTHRPATAMCAADRSTGERLSPPQAFKRMLDQYILPRIAQMAAGSVRAAMQTKVRCLSPARCCPNGHISRPVPASACC